MDVHHPPSIADVSTVFIAVAALFVAVWQAMATRKHNKLSVRPLLSFFLAQSQSPGEAPVGISVRNNGVGPAIVTGFRLEVDGRVVQTHGPDPWPEALKVLGLGGDWFQRHYPFVPEPLASGQLLPLLTCDAKELYEQGKRKTFLAALNRLQVVITYESVYREQFSITSQRKPFPTDQ